MKNILLFIFACLSLSVSAQTSDSLRIKNLETDFVNLSNRVNQLQAIQNQQKQTIASQNAKISELEKQLGIKATELDSTLNEKSQSLKSELNTKLGETDSKITQTAESLNQSISSSKLIAIIGIIAAIVLLIIVFVILRSKISSKDSAIDKIRSAQDSLAAAQKLMQEESVKLDSKLVELLDKQMSAPTVETPKDSEPDHSLALKVADEIIRIETNLSKMDSSVKGYKQLSKAVERIRTNFMANGYEIVDMLNKPYNEGMKVTANFVSDESLADGEQKITGITKPQINYNGKMIQSAQITVSQNI